MRYSYQFVEVVDGQVFGRLLILLLGEDDEGRAGNKLIRGEEVRVFHVLWERLDVCQLGCVLYQGVPRHSTILRLLDVVHVQLLECANGFRLTRFIVVEIVVIKVIRRGDDIFFHRSAFLLFCLVTYCLYVRRLYHRLLLLDHLFNHFHLLVLSLVDHWHRNRSCCLVGLIHFALPVHYLYFIR